MIEGDRRDPRTEVDVRLLAYQVAEQARQNTSWQEDMSRAILRIEQKIDDKTTVLEARVADVERWREARKQVELQMEKVAADGFTTWQKASIAAAITFGLVGLFVAFLTAVATILVTVL